MIFRAKFLIRPNHIFSALPAASAVRLFFFVFLCGYGVGFLCGLRVHCGERVFDYGSAMLSSGVSSAGTRRSRLAFAVSIEKVEDGRHVRGGNVAVISTGYFNVLYLKP